MKTLYDKIEAGERGRVQKQSNAILVYLDGKIFHSTSLQTRLWLEEPKHVKAQIKSHR